MHKKKLDYQNYLYIFWALIVIVAILLTLNTTNMKKSDNYDKEIEASTLTLNCFNEIKDYNIERGMVLDPQDKYSSYLLGSDKKTFITTTSGSAISKRSTINPNFGGLFVKLFSEKGLKENDQVVLCFSGSFPCLNIACLCACETMNLKAYIIVTLGSSQYGANDTSYTFFDMMETLYSKGLISYRANQVSFGGEYDNGSEFGQSIDFSEFDKSLIGSKKQELIDRVELKGIEFVYKDTYKESIERRLEAIDDNCSSVKMFVNVGGNIIGLGYESASKDYLHGVIEPSYLTTSLTYDDVNSGLLERFLLNGVTCINMLNIKGICKDYNIPYDQALMPTVDSSLDIYYDIEYHKVVPIVALALSFIIMIYSGIVNYKNYKIRSKDYE